MAQLQWHGLGTLHGHKAVAAAQMGGFVVVARLAREGDRIALVELEVRPGSVNSIDLTSEEQNWNPEPGSPHLSVADLRQIRLADIAAEIADLEDDLDASIQLDDARERALDLRRRARRSNNLLGYRRRMDRDAHLDWLATAFVYASVQPGASDSPVATVASVLSTSVDQAAVLVAQARRNGYLTSVGPGVARGWFTPTAIAKLHELETAYFGEDQ